MKQSPKQAPKPMKVSTLKFAFEKKNYIFLTAGIALVLLGFVLMSGGASQDPNVFSEEIFSFRRITLAPFIVLVGYGVIGYAIMYKSKKSKTDISAVKSRVGLPTDSTNFRFDLNASGTISSADVTDVKARSGLVMP